MSLGTFITQIGLPNSTPVEQYLKVRGLTDKYTVENVVVLPSDELPLGEVRTKLQERLPLGAIPALQLADGTVIDESNAVMAYLEAAHPEGRLEGTDAKTIALNRSWNDRIEKSITENGFDAFRCGPGKAIFVGRYPCLEGAQETFSLRLQHFLKVIDPLVPKEGLLGGARPNIADLRFVTAFEFLTNKDFGAIVGDGLEVNKNVNALFKRQQAFLAAL